MHISFHGAARTVTGSKHLLHLISGKKILLDCGLFQGMGRQTLELNSNWGFDPAEVSYVILSHAHIDHIGLLPKLVKDGFTGKVFCTPPTVDLAKLLLLDSAHIQELDVAHVNRMREKQNRPAVVPLYTEEDAKEVFNLFEPVPYNTPFDIDDDVALVYTDCGHILGSAAINLRINEQGRTINLAFSGDVGRYNDLILRPPVIFPQADYIILESTYGNKLHEHAFQSADRFLTYITETCIEKKGKLIIPAFSVGRTQEILYLLNRLETEHRLPDISYYVDSPLSIAATEVIRAHPDCFNAQVEQLLRKDNDVFAFRGLHYTNSVEESKDLSATNEPCVIIAASGMAEAGRVKHHIQGGVNNPANTILLVGYCDPDSLGGKLKSGAKNVDIYGVTYDVTARVGVMDSMSAHGDYDDLLRWLDCQNADKVIKVFLVHGEYETQVAFSRRLENKSFKDVDIPSLHQEIEL